MPPPCAGRDDIPESRPAQRGDPLDVRLSEEQELLRKSAREVLERECPMRLVRATLEDPAPRGGEALFGVFARLGWTGLAVPARYGGAGLGQVELGVLLEEMGRVLAPAPLLASALLASQAVALAGNEAQHRRWLPDLAAGRRRATLALAGEDGRSDPGRLPLPAQAEPGGWRVSGALGFVPDAVGADLLLVPARAAGAPAPVLLALTPAASGLSLRPLAFVDATQRLAELRLEDVRVGPDAVLAGPDGRGAPLEALLDRARVALCAELCGVAASVLEQSVAYARTREQFGRPIGSFQAIQHRCADMLVELEAARSATYLAAGTLDAADGEAHLAACMAKAFCSDAGPRIAAAGIQIHGGQGFTWEQDLHLYYKRAKARELALGDAAWHREEVARLLLDG
jgi:alkylation response protein AidB-like acyl-CoA dehydrogenase